MKTALFGGTFDPIHRAHLTVAMEAANCFALDRVLFVPAGDPPHKIAAADYDHRYAMVALACLEDPRFAPSRLEEGRGKSFSIDTIERALKEKSAPPPLYFIIGADAFEEITAWHRWRDVIAAVEFIVVARPGHSITAPPGARVHRLETVALPVSSSDIRLALARGEISNEVPDSVASYIRAHGLYREH